MEIIVKWSKVITVDETAEENTAAAWDTCSVIPAPLRRYSLISGIPIRRNYSPHARSWNPQAGL